jgi:hypothetical protein
VSISRSTSLLVTAAAAPIGAGLLPLAMASAEGCNALTDPKGDSEFKPQGAATLDRDPNLDILSIDHAVEGDMFVSTIKVADLINAPANHFGDQFAAGYAHGQIRNGAASTGQFSAVTQLSVNGPPLTDPNGRTNPGFVQSGLKFTFDQKNSYVIATLPIADVEKYGKAPYAGATLEGVYVTSATDTDLLASQADVLPDGTTSSAPSKLTYAAGDNAASRLPCPRSPASAPSRRSSVTAPPSPPNWSTPRVRRQPARS